MAADRGNVEAQVLLASRLEIGKDIEQNIPQALALYNKAAAQNHVGAMMSLAEVYVQGKIVSRNYSEAFEWCRKAANLDADYSQFVLGIMYTKGIGVTRDYSEAQKCFLKSVGKGSGYKYSSCLLLSEFYEKGLGVAIDSDKASYWMKMAKNSKEPLQAYMILGLWFFDNKITGPDYKETLKWWSIGAGQGDPLQQALVGFMYESGLGTGADSKEAAKWFAIYEAGGNNLDKKMTHLRSRTPNFSVGFRVPWAKIAACAGLGTINLYGGRSLGCYERNTYHFEDEPSMQGTSCCCCASIRCARNFRCEFVRCAPKPD